MVQYFSGHVSSECRVISHPAVQVAGSDELVIA